MVVEPKSMNISSTVTTVCSNWETSQNDEIKAQILKLLNKEFAMHHNSRRYKDFLKAYRGD